MTTKPSWIPSQAIIENSNIHKMMRFNKIANYQDFWKWSVKEKKIFWAQTVEEIGIKFDRNYSTIFSSQDSVEDTIWLKDAKLNIVDSCFQKNDDDISVILQEKNKAIKKITQRELKNLVNQIASSFRNIGIQKGDNVAICMPMTLESIAIYLAAIKAGNPVVTIADSFSSSEIETRITITKPKVIFTQFSIERMGKSLPLYNKIIETKVPKVVLIGPKRQEQSIRTGDVYFDDFKKNITSFNSEIQDPNDTITILFSSGTTGEPKAIPWNHTTPIKSASDGFYHHDIQQDDVVCWPTNLGWMMGPWLVFATLINKGCIALYYDAPLDANFGKFVEAAKVTMLGVIPSIVKHWKTNKSMEGLDWTSIKCFSSTGEVSNPNEMNYLMKLAGNKPVIEYCGGTEIGGGYVSSTIVQPNIASTFSTQCLGGEFVLLDEDGKNANKGEVFILPPIMGLSNKLLRKNHHNVYYKGLPKDNGRTLRRHGDELEQMNNGYYRALGRVDDSINLGGIKVSSIQIEEVINRLNFIEESAAIAISPEGGGPSELVIFYVEINSGLDIHLRHEEMQKAIRVELNPLFKISDTILIKKLPRTASGKIIRKKLRENRQK